MSSPDSVATIFFFLQVSCSQFWTQDNETLMLRNYYLLPFRCFFFYCLSIVLFEHWSYWVLHCLLPHSHSHLHINVPNKCDTLYHVHGILIHYLKNEVCWSHIYLHSFVREVHTYTSMLMSPKNTVVSIMLMTYGICRMKFVDVTFVYIHYCKEGL